MPSDISVRLGDAYSVRLEADDQARSDWAKTFQRIRFSLLAAAEARPRPWWFESVMATAYELTRLEQGWNGKDGLPATTENALTALRLLSRLSRPLNEAPFLYPSPDGGLVIEVQSRNRRLTVLVEGALVAFWSSLDGYQAKTFKLDDPADQKAFLEAFERARNEARSRQRYG